MASIKEEDSRGTVFMFAITKLLGNEPLKGQIFDTENFYKFLNDFIESPEINDFETLKKINENLSCFTRKTKLSEDDEINLLKTLKWMRDFKPITFNCLKLNIEKTTNCLLKVSVSNFEQYEKEAIHRIPNKILEDVGKIGYVNAKIQEMVGTSIRAVHGKKQFFSVYINKVDIKNVLLMITNLGKAWYCKETDTIDVKINGKLKLDVCLIGVFTEFCPISIVSSELNEKVITDYLDLLSKTKLLVGLETKESTT